MGYASYLEDIVRRYTESVDSIRNSINSTISEVSYVDIAIKKQSEHTLSLCQDLLNEVKELVDLATDPLLNLTDEYIRLKNEVREKNCKLAEMKGKIEYLLIKHKIQLEKRDKDFEKQMASMTENHKKDILKAKKETRDEDQRLFIEFGNDFRELLNNSIE